MPGYKLHFVGTKLYTIKSFEIEAESKAVNRAIPFTTIKGLKWGQKILLAQYNKEKDKPAKAIVFGYMILNGISHNLHQVIKHELEKKLKTVKTKDEETIRRVCGSYKQQQLLIKDSLQELSEKIQKTLEEFHLTPNIYKFFIYGEYIPITPKEISPIKFSRNLITVKFPYKLLKSRTMGPYLNWVQDYKQKKYINKLQKQLLEKKDTLTNIFT